MKIKKVLDLTQPLYHNCPCWPTLDPPTVERMLYIPRHDANVEKLALNTHTATHVDVPYHKLAEGAALDQVPVETWIGEGIVAEVPLLEERGAISAEVLREAAAHMVEADIVMLHTGWGARRGFTREYLMDWPALDESGAAWLVERKAKVVGTDGLSIDLYDPYLPADKGPVAHKILLGAGVPLVEEVYLEEIARMGRRRWTFFCLPMAIQGAGGSPARVVAIDEGSSERTGTLQG